MDDSFNRLKLCRPARSALLPASFAGLTSIVTSIYPSFYKKSPASLCERDFLVYSVFFLYLIYIYTTARFTLSAKVKVIIEAPKRVADVFHLFF